MFNYLKILKFEYIQLFLNFFVRIELFKEFKVTPFKENNHYVN